MASLSRTRSGAWIVQFRHGYERRTIHIGKMPVRAAQQTKARIEALHQTKMANVPADAATVAWLSEIGDTLADALARAGLIEHRQRCDLQSFLDRYLDTRKDVKPGSLINLKSTARLLVDYFGVIDLRWITTEKADQFHAAHLERFASASLAKHIKRCRQFFRAAIRWKLITDNPFAGIAAGAMDNPQRLHFVPQEVVYRLIEDARTFGVVLALSRFGGLRCPSELVQLDWRDFDFARGRFRVRSPKTEAQGKPSRWVPLFPDLRALLEPHRKPSGPVCRGIDLNKNMRSRLLRLIARCGLEPWPRLFHNMRASRQTELTQHFPLHVVCEWLGNSPAVAARHYLTVREADFEAATALQSALQTGSNSSALERTDCSGSLEKCRASRENQRKQLTLTGLPANGKKRFALGHVCKRLGGCAAICAAGGLGLVVARWEKLTAAARREILKLARKAAIFMQF